MEGRPLTAAPAGTPLDSGDEAAPIDDTIEPGKRCDLAIWGIERPAELVYRMGFNPLHARVWRGS